MRDVFLTIFAVGFCLFALAGGCSLSCVQNGHVKVVKQFGNAQDQVLTPGLNFALPWRTTEDVDVRQKEFVEHSNVMTSDGLQVKLEASVLYKLAPNDVVSVFKQHGQDWQDRIVMANFVAAMKDSTSGFNSKDFYSENRGLIEKKILERAKSMMGGVTVDNVLLKSVTLPDSVVARIESTTNAKQDAERMQYVVQKERLEAERKTVEAEGIAKAQKIIKADLTHEYLVYLWIQALTEHAKHGNSTIYVPVGNDGMPIMKNVDPKK